MLGNREREQPPTTRSERLWFVAYSIASTIYRWLVLFGLTLFIAGKLFFVGVVLALWGLVAWGVVPLVRGARYVLSSPGLRRVRRRAVLTSAALAVAAVGLGCFLPMPLRTLAEGVVWVPDEATVRAGTDGFIVRLLAVPGENVQRGKPLFLCEDPVISTRIRVLGAEIAELQAKRDAAWLEDRTEAAMLDEEIARRETNFERENERRRELVVRSPESGTFVVARARDLPGRFVKQGDLLAHVLSDQAVTARVLVTQEDIALVRHRTRGASVRVAEMLGPQVEATIRREVPAASEELPSSALGTLGGGKLAVDPTDREGTRSLSKLFQFDLEFAVHTVGTHVGGRVFVRFDHGWEPLASRWCRSLRRLFLARFHV